MILAFLHTEAHNEASTPHYLPDGELNAWRIFCFCRTDLARIRGYLFIKYANRRSRMDFCSRQNHRPFVSRHRIHFFRSRVICIVKSAGQIFATRVIRRDITIFRRVSNCPIGRVSSEVLFAGSVRPEEGRALREGLLRRLLCSSIWKLSRKRRTHIFGFSANKT